MLLIPPDLPLRRRNAVLETIHPQLLLLLDGCHLALHQHPLAVAETDASGNCINA